jgi:hypothetical protein
MNPETQSTRAKTTPSSVNSVVQDIADSPRGNHDRVNSGDVGLHKTTGGPAASVTDLWQVRPTRSAGHVGDGPVRRGRAA